MKHRRKEDVYPLTASVLSWKAASYLSAKESWKSYVRSSSLEEREKRKSFYSWPTGELLPKQKAEGKMSPTAIKTSSGCSKSWPDFALYYWGVSSNRGRGSLLGSEPIGQWLLMVPCSCQPSCAHQPMSEGCSLMGDLKLQKSKQSIYW